MHFDTVRAHEWYGEGGYWFRVEVWRDERGQLEVTGYRRELSFWREHHSQALAVACKFHLGKALDAPVAEAA